MNKLNQEEREILEAFESGNVNLSKDAAETQKRHQEYVQKPCSGKMPGLILDCLPRFFVVYRREPLPMAFRTKR